MVTVGVVLLIAAVLLGVDIVLENSENTNVMIMGQELSLDIWGLFALGAATGVLVVLGVQLLAQGLVQERRKAKAERKALRQQPEPAVASDDVSPTVPQPLVAGPLPGAAPPAGPPTTAGEDGSPPRIGPFDRVVARVSDPRKRDKPDQPTAAI